MSQQCIAIRGTVSADYVYQKLNFWNVPLVVVPQYGRYITAHHPYGPEWFICAAQLNFLRVIYVGALVWSFNFSNFAISCWSTTFVAVFSYLFSVEAVCGVLILVWFQHLKKNKEKMHTHKQEPYLTQFDEGASTNIIF